MIDLVQPGQRISKDVWIDNVVVLKALHDKLRQHHCRSWMAWNVDISRLLRKTLEYTTSTVEANEILIGRWEGLVGRGNVIWDHIVGTNRVQATGLDDLENFEQNLMVGEDGKEDDNELGSDENEADDSENGGEDNEN